MKPGAPSPTLVDDATFMRRVQAQYEILETRLRDPSLGTGLRTFGSEVEVVLLGADDRPRRVNEAVLKEGRARGLPVTTELLSHQVEINGPILPFAGNTFSSFGHILQTQLGALSKIASRHDARLGLLGILPTLAYTDATSGYFSVNPRYPQLNHGLQRHYPMANLKLQGQKDQFQLATHDVAFEGANTSLQGHLSVSIQEFVRFYNAGLIATGLTLAVAGGSPWLFGHDLWAENRIPVFEAATRGRAYFGDGWIYSPLEPFAHSLKQPPVIPMVSGAPDHQLQELQLAHHSVHPWLRPVGPDGLRLEFRALPSGPTTADMAANLALLMGLTLALGSGPVDEWTNNPRGFTAAKNNFYTAAQYGTEATFSWLVNGRPESHNACELVRRLLPQVHKSLVKAGSAPKEAEHHLMVIDRRAALKRTATTWLRRAGHIATKRHGNRRNGLAAATLRYLELSQNGAGRPVAEWPDFS